MTHKGYKAVTGAFVRYHLEPSQEIKDNPQALEALTRLPKEERLKLLQPYRGGRVNAQTRGLFDMMAERGLMDRIGYPLCGDQGLTMDIFNNLVMPMEYGAETAWRLQCNSWVNNIKGGREPLLLGIKALQLDIGGSDDLPLAHGKTQEEIKQGLAKMTGQITNTFLAIAGEANITPYWPTAEKFLKSFRRQQARSVYLWKRQSIIDHNKVIPISGNISDETLQEIAYQAVEAEIHKFYNNPQHTQQELRNQFLPSIADLKASLGQNKFNEFSDLILSYRERIA